MISRRGARDVCDMRVRVQTLEGTRSNEHGRVTGNHMDVAWAWLTARVWGAACGACPRYIP